MEVRVEQVAASVTWPLRREVLRPLEAADDQALPDDDDPTTASFAVFDPEGRVVGTARVAAEAAPLGIGAVARGSDPFADGGPLASWRLRGMATRPDLRGRGIGASMIDHVSRHVAAHGGGLLWCNARLPALDFYRRAGFVEQGAPWDDPAIGPHQVMWRTVVPDDEDRNGMGGGSG